MRLSGYCVTLLFCPGHSIAMMAAFAYFTRPKYSGSDYVFCAFLDIITAQIITVDYFQNLFGNCW